MESISIPCGVVGIFSHQSIQMRSLFTRQRRGLPPVAGPFSADIRTDPATNQKCCLFKHSILKFVDENIIAVAGPSGDHLHTPVNGVSIASASSTSLTHCKASVDVFGLDATDWSRNRAEVENIPGVWVLIGSYVPGNAGHVLGDEVWAVWQALCVFGLQDRAVNVITDNGFRHQQQYRALTKNPIHSFEEFRGKKVSFENLIVGMGRNGYALAHYREHPSGPIQGMLPTSGSHLAARAAYLPPFCETFDAFRRHAYRIWGIDESSSDFRRGKRHVLVLDKDPTASEHPCRLWDAVGITKEIRQICPDHHVELVNWNGMSIGEQIRKMSKADAVVSLPGSDLMNCVFMHPRGRIICPARFVGTCKEGSAEIGIWFQHTHQCIEIRDVSRITQDGCLFSKLNDPNVLRDHLRDLGSQN